MGRVPPCLVLTSKNRGCILACNSAAKQIAHPTADQYYNYLMGVRFDPGAPSEAFKPMHQLPAIVARGAGRVAGSLRVFQHAQLYFHQQIGINGLGGLQAGQVILQPLFDPNSQG